MRTLPSQTRYADVSYPWGNTLKSYFEPKTDKDQLRTSILNIIFTLPGERVMLTDFGSRLPEVVFEPNDNAALAEIQSYVVDAVHRWDPRIEVVSIKFDTNEHDVNVVIVYKDKQDPFNQTDTITVELNEIASVLERI